MQILSLVVAIQKAVYGRLSSLCISQKIANLAPPLRLSAHDYDDGQTYNFNAIKQNFLTTFTVNKFISNDLQQSVKIFNSDLNSLTAEGCQT